MKKKAWVIILLIVFIFSAVYLYKNFPYRIIKSDINKNYEGIGQEKIRNKDGYFTTFTTFGESPKTYLEYKQNGDASWSKNEYWDGEMSDNGCGITSIAIVLSGYNLSYTPEDLRQKYYPVIDHDKLPQELYLEYGITNSGFYYDKASLSNDSIESHLKTDRPIIVCVWDKPSRNRWTLSSHHMVLLATDGMGMVYVSNPNGSEYDSKSSGWYDINEVTPYIAKALYIEEY